MLSCHLCISIVTLTAPIVIGRFPKRYEVLNLDLNGPISFGWVLYITKPLQAQSFRHECQIREILESTLPGRGEKLGLKSGPSEDNTSGAPPSPNILDFEGGAPLGPE